MRFEKEYSGLEMLTVNDHHWMFWGKRTLVRWIEKITQSEREREVLLAAFDDYQKHFRTLALSGKKWFKIILNYKTFSQYVARIDIDEATDTIVDTLKFLELPNFHLLFYHGSEEVIEEYEILSKNNDESVCMLDNVCVVIKESRIDIDSLYYFLYFNDTEALIADHINRYNDYRRLCLDQYRNRYSGAFAFLRDRDVSLYSDLEVQRVSKHILDELLHARRQQR